jgi:hypothetical protein
VEETLKAIAWVLGLGGILTGLILGIQDEELIFSIAVPYWVSGAISCLVFLALGEIYRFTREIHQKHFPEQYAAPVANPEQPATPAE